MKKTRHCLRLMGQRNVELDDEILKGTCNEKPVQKTNYSGGFQDTCEYLAPEIDYITKNSVLTCPILQVIRAENFKEINNLQSEVDNKNSFWSSLWFLYFEI